MTQGISATLVAAAAGGYLLGRTKKGKLALTAATWVLGRKYGLTPSDLLTQGAKALGRSPAVGQLAEQVRGELLKAGRSAVTAELGRRLDAFTGTLEDRTRTLREAADSITGAAGQDSGDDAGPESGSDSESGSGPDSESGREAGKGASAGSGDGSSGGTEPEGGAGEEAASGDEPGGERPARGARSGGNGEESRRGGGGAGKAENGDAQGGGPGGGKPEGDAEGGEPEGRRRPRRAPGPVKRAPARGTRERAGAGASAGRRATGGGR